MAELSGQTSPCCASEAQETTRTDLRETVRERYAAAARAAGDEQGSCGCGPLGLTDAAGTLVFGSSLYAGTQTEGATATAVYDRARARGAGVENIELVKGYIEEIPIPDASVDVVISNCVINLADERAVLAEAARVRHRDSRDAPRTRARELGDRPRPQAQRGRRMNAQLHELPVLGCHLDTEGLAQQHARYRSLAAHVESSWRRPDELVVAFDGDVDVALLAETLSVERVCCSFFELRVDGRELSVQVARPEQRQALDAIAHALDVTALP